MKNLINLSVILVVLAVLSSTVFAQEANVKTRTKVKAQTLQGTNTQGPNWVDADGDGICDNIGTGTSGKQMKGSQAKGEKGNRKNSFGDGSGLRPQDGTGLGSGNGSGTCDGTGPKGSVKRSGRK